MTQDVDDANLFLEFPVPLDQIVLSALGSKALTEALLGHSGLYVDQQSLRRVPLNIVLLLQPICLGSSQASRIVAVTFLTVIAWVVIAVNKHVVHDELICALVLTQFDNASKDWGQGASQPTQVSHQVQESVHFSDVDIFVQRHFVGN